MKNLFLHEETRLTDVRREEVFFDQAINDLSNDLVESLANI